MHSLFRIGEPLPVAPGESPFHLRGVYFDRVVSRARKDPGGLPALLDALSGERVRAFVQQKFSWNGWYDALPIMPMYEAIARLRGQDFETCVREGTRRGAIEAIPSLFRFALRMTGAAVLSGRLAQMVIYSSDFTRLGIQHMSDGRGSATGSGIPLYIAPQTANLSLGYFQAALELRGKLDVQGRYTTVTKDGERDGFETVTIGYEFTWRPKAARGT
jgi:hypothetical protein